MTMKRLRFYTDTDRYMGWANLEDAPKWSHWLHSGNYFKYGDEKITTVTDLIELYTEES